MHKIKMLLNVVCLMLYSGPVFAIGAGYFLYDHKEFGSEFGANYLSVGGGYQDVFWGWVYAKPRDILKLHGQVEVTNDLTGSVIGQIRLAVNYIAISHAPYQTIQDGDGMHHSPMWIDSTFTVETEGWYRIAVQYAAYGPSGNIKIESGHTYGGIKVEHYRLSSQYGGYGHLLTNSISNRSAKIGYFWEYGNVTAYQITETVAKDDVIIMSGQATGYPSGGWDLFGMTILSPSGSFLGAWSTENLTPSVGVLPLHTRAVEKIYESGSRTYDLVVMGGGEATNSLLAGYGGIYLTKFSPVSRSAGQELLSTTWESYYTGIYNDGNWKRMATVYRQVKSGDTLRAVSSVQVTGDGSPVQCSTYIDFNQYGASGSSYSPSSSKGMGSALSAIVIRSEGHATMWFTGWAAADLYLNCSGYSSAYSYIPDARIFVDHFGRR